MASATHEQQLSDTVNLQDNPARGQLDRRAQVLVQNEVAYIGNSEFCLPERSSESNEQLIRVAAARTTRPPRDLPAHLARMCEVDLLTADEERALFRSMNYLKYRANALRSRLDPSQPDLALVEETERLLAAAQKIRNLLIQANMRLAISVVKKFVSPQRSFDDMLSDGVFSLMQAIDKFDYDRGFRFSTYAYRAIARNAYRKIQGSRREKAGLVNGENEVFEVEDQGHTSLLDERTWELLRGTLSTMMDRLDRRERFIVRSRYALGGHRKVKTFQSLADKLGLSKERVRQLEQRAVAKLRRWSTESQVLT